MDSSLKIRAGCGTAKWANIAGKGDQKESIPEKNNHNSAEGG